MIGIIGFGRFGTLITRYLSRDFDVFVYNRSDKAGEFRAAGAEPADLALAAGQRVVVLSVPISRMEATLERIAPLLAPRKTPPAAVRVLYPPARAQGSRRGRRSGAPRFRPPDPIGIMRTPLSWRKRRRWDLPREQGRTRDFAGGSRRGGRRRRGWRGG